MDTVQKFYADADATRSAAIEPDVFIREILPLFEHNPGHRFLDIGCYDGSKTVLIRERIGAREAYGIDFLSGRLETARSRGINTKLTDLNESIPLDFPDAFFDCIYMGDIIEHLFCPDYLLEESFRLLCPGGYAVITTPNLASWRNRVSLLLGWQPVDSEVSTRYRVGNPRAPKSLPSGHIRVFTSRALRELVEHYGFLVERLTGFRAWSSHHDALERITHLLDRFVALARPTLCAELLLKARKPAVVTSEDGRGP